jgi:hypothetical protein
VVIERDFNTVGQGAFYTEKFEIEGRSFEIVYDCGALGPNYTKNIDREIKKQFNKDDTINIIFVSHFHADHVNGIEKLLARCNIKNIIIPLLEEESRKIMLLDCLLNGFNEKSFLFKFINDPKNEIFTISEKYNKQPPNIPNIIEIEENLQYDNVSQDRIISLEELENGNGRVRSGISIKLKDNIDWVFIPFNFRQDSYYEKIRDYLCTHTEGSDDIC